MMILFMVFFKHNHHLSQKKLELGNYDILSKSTERLQKAILPLFKGKRGPTGKHELQKPTWFAVPELSAVPWLNPQKFSFVNLLEDNYVAIKEEFNVLLNNLNSEISTIKSSVEGEWRVFYFYNQGEKVTKAFDLCPFTGSIIQNLPTLCTRSGIGYVYFSILHPQTHILPHCGPCNLKIRCHLPLIVPNDCKMRVGNETRSWIEGKVVLFDDSFEHEVWQNSLDQIRVVLLIDFWHPDLTEAEIETIISLQF